tara:strand:- start:2739 stop:3530 length:792 start_codon:yes stop_codon:yes gene_type:complete
MNSPCNLNGLNILVTRPYEQALVLSELISKSHGRPVSFPTLEIIGPENKNQIRLKLSKLTEAHLLIFISPNAVKYSFPLMPDNIPSNLYIAAIGSTTAKVLYEHGLEPQIVPEANMDSEELLSMLKKQKLDGRKILIIRGNQGRDYLKKGLEDLGAVTEYIEVYRTRIPERDAKNLVDNWDKFVDVVTVTSVQILENLFILTGDRGKEKIKKTPILVVSQRLAEKAKLLGCKKIYIASSANDENMMKGLCEAHKDLISKNNSD